MPGISFNEVLEGAKMLPAQEKRSLYESLRQWLSEPKTSPSEAEFAQSLVEQGLVSSLPDVTLLPPANRQPVVVQGPPVSQTILEERR
jgi:hypothetical protein